MNQNRIPAICLAVLFIRAGLFCPAQPPDFPDQMPDFQATESAGKIRQNLEEMLKLLNESNSPSSSDIASSAKLLNESKRHVGKFDEQQKAQYLLLQGWASYFQNDLPKAYTSSVAACRLDQSYGDAWASQAAFALLLNKKPMTPRPQRPEPRQRTRTQEPTMEMAEMYGMQGLAAQNSILKFDIKQLKLDLLEQKIKPFRLDCLNQTAFDWKPADQALCILYWQKFPPEKAAAEPNKPSGSARPPQTRRSIPVSEPVVPAQSMFEAELGLGYGYGNAQDPLSVQTAACSKIVQASWLSQKRFFKFVSVNLDRPDYKVEIINEIFKQSQPWAVALAADQEPEVPLKPADALTPLLVIADPAGIVRYAGPADSFIVPMLLPRLEPGQTPQPVQTTQLQTPSSPVEPNTTLKSPLPSAPQTAPVANQLEQNPQQVAAGVDDSKLAEEDKIEAEKILAYTNGLFMPAAQKRVITYKRGVDFCRQIMQKYPGTSYAHQARELLRQVPENQRQRYGITDQELGL